MGPGLYFIMDSERYFIWLLAMRFPMRHLSAVEACGLEDHIGTSFSCFQISVPQCLPQGMDKAGLHLCLLKGTESFCSQQWSN